MTPIGRIHLFTGVAVVLSLEGAALAQKRTQPMPETLTIESLTGRDTFDAYCATCHGRSGTGNGPLTPVLRTPPADLTRLSVASGGEFPRERIVGFVTGDGRAIAAHGTSDMPVWGPIFRSLDPSDARVRVRLQNVVDYIATLQR